MNIVAHVLVKNEARFIWYSVMSVIDYVDKILLWDDGSTDETEEVVKTILNTNLGKRKIDFLELRNKQDFREDNIRQKMLDQTSGDWILMVDGDEIWWQDSIINLTSKIRKFGNNTESIVVPTINLVGDMFHYQEAVAGKFILAGKKGHLNLRAVSSKIPGLRSFGRDWNWGWVDEKGTYVQNRNTKKIKFINSPYLHVSHLQRAGCKSKDTEVFRRNFKTKYEIGINFPYDFYYPEVFFKPRPSVVPSPWKTMSLGYKLNAYWQTPLKKIKRKLYLF